MEFRLVCIKADPSMDFPTDLLEHIPNLSLSVLDLVRILESLGSTNFYLLESSKQTVLGEDVTKRAKFVLDSYTSLFDKLNDFKNKFV